MQFKKRLAFLALALAFVLSVTPFQTRAAHPVPDLTREGSITIQMRDGSQPVPGGTLTIYRVGEVHEDDGNYSFRPTGDFQDCGEDFEEIDSPSLAQRLADYAEENDIEGLETQEIGRNGTVVFEDLEPGLYLIVQHDAAEGYYPVLPFLVSIPYLEDGEYLYDVDATPKVELEPEPTDPTGPSDPSDPTGPSDPSDPTGPSDPSDPTGPSDPSDPTGPSDPSDPTGPSDPSDPSSPSDPTKPSTKPTDPPEPTKPTLPQTGQMNWPVPVLACLGMALFAAGWYLYFGKEKQDAQ